jgi:hypothetical protein
MGKSHYEILDVEPTASATEIRTSYKTLLKVWHPDRFVDEIRIKAEEMTRLLNEADQILSDPVKRAAYDIGLKSGDQTGAPAPATIEPDISSRLHCQVKTLWLGGDEVCAHLETFRDLQAFASRAAEATAVPDGCGMLGGPTKSGAFALGSLDLSACVDVVMLDSKLQVLRTLQYVGPGQISVPSNPTARYAMCLAAGTVEGHEIQLGDRFRA